MPHTRQGILSFLESRQLLTLATHGRDSIRCRCMFFANGADFTFYMLAGKGSVKAREIAENPQVTLLVIDEGRSMLESTEVEVIGNAGLIEDPEERRQALELLAPKNPAAEITRKIGSEELFDMIRVRPSTIIFRIYGEISSGISATVVDFRKDPHGAVIDG